MEDEELLLLDQLVNILADNGFSVPASLEEDLLKVVEDIIIWNYDRDKD